MILQTTKYHSVVPFLNPSNSRIKTNSQRLRASKFCGWHFTLKEDMERFAETCMAKIVLFN